MSTNEGLSFGHEVFSESITDQIQIQMGLPEPVVATVGLKQIHPGQGRRLYRGGEITPTIPALTADRVAAG